MIFQKYKTLLPLLLFIVVAIALWQGMGRNPRLIPSPLIGKPLPLLNAELVDLNHQKFSFKNELGQPFLINVFATWCSACLMEHPLLVEIAREQHVKIIGIDYKDTRAGAKDWLARHGNPFDRVVFDSQGQYSMELGIYGTPETFIVDADGVVRYKHIGVLTRATFNNEVLPILERLR